MMIISALIYPVRTSVPAVTLLSVLLAGCAATEGKYPSLAIRDVERASEVIATAPAIGAERPEAEPSAELMGRLSRLRQDAVAAHDEFTQAAARTARLVGSARGAAVATERWADAQVGLANLESIRSRTAIALAELDILFVDAATAFEPDRQIGEARAAVVSLVADEDVTLAALRGQLRG